MLYKNSQAYSGSHYAKCSYTITSVKRDRLMKKNKHSRVI